MTASAERPDLVALLRGELDRSEVLAVDAHLAGCGACRDELAEVATAHAVLSRASRTEIGELGTAGASDADGLPPLPSPRRRRLPRVVGITAAAAVAGIVAGAGLSAVLTDEDDRGVAPSPYATAPLVPVDSRLTVGSGHVDMVAEARARTSLTVVADRLPTARGGRFYYAWLLDPRTDKMLPLGQLGPSGSATFELDDTLLSEYAAVDVSLEDDDGDPAHSATSVLRGRYAEPPQTSS
jgi:hypothetical protein